MKHHRLLGIGMLLLALVVSLPLVAQDETPEIAFVYTGTELEKLDQGVIVQTWTMPNSLETQHIVAALNARAQANDPEVRYVFADDRMYHLRDNQVIHLWLLRAGQWVEAPLLTVQYRHTGRELQRIVNGEVQQAWTMPNGVETQQLVALLQADANKLIAAHVYQEVYVDEALEHVPDLVAKDMALHYLPVDLAPDLSWYNADVAEVFAQALAEPGTEPVVAAADDLVITRHPTGTHFADLLHIPPMAETETLYDVYRIRDNQVTDWWLAYDLPALLKTER